MHFSVEFGIVGGLYHVVLQDGWVDGWIDGWMDGWEDGRMDGWMVALQGGWRIRGPDTSMEGSDGIQLPCGSASVEWSPPASVEWSQATMPATVPVRSGPHQQGYNRWVDTPPPPTHPKN